jgi:hypothetical protein
MPFLWLAKIQMPTAPLLEGEQWASSPGEINQRRPISRLDLVFELTLYQSNNMALQRTQTHP